MGSGTPTECPVRVSGSLQLGSLPSLTRTLVATEWAPNPPRRLEGPGGVRPPAMLSPPAPAPSLTSRLTTVWAAAWGPSGHPDGPSCQRAGTVPGTQPQEASFCPNPLRHPGALRTGGCPSHLRSQKWGQEGTCWLFPGSPGPHWSGTSPQAGSLAPSPWAGEAGEVTPPAQSSLSSTPACGGTRCVPPAHSCRRQACGHLLPGPSPCPVPVW